VEVERSIIRYDYNDFFKLSFGRTTRPFGYWNTAFHHGAWLQTTISRPEHGADRRTFIPVHFVGLLAEGNIPSGGAGLSYNVGLATAGGSIISRPGDAGRQTITIAPGSPIFTRGPPSSMDCRWGFRSTATKSRCRSSARREMNFANGFPAAHIVWTKENPEFLAEFANVNHKNILTNAVTNNQAYYGGQVGYRLPWLEKTLKPYLSLRAYRTRRSAKQVFTNQGPGWLHRCLRLRTSLTTASLRASTATPSACHGSSRERGLFPDGFYFLDEPDHERHQQTCRDIFLDDPLGRR